MKSGNTMRWLFTLLFISIYSQLSLAQSIPTILDTEFNCSSQYTVTNKFAKESLSVANPGDKNIYELVIPESKGETRWEKKKANRNCLSSDPEDCMVWCLVEVPAHPGLQTSVTLSIPEAPHNAIIFKENAYAYIEIEEVCKSEISKELKNSISKILIRQGYMNANWSERKIRKNFNEALKAFQIDNKLPESSMNGPTLRYLARL